MILPGIFLQEKEDGCSAIVSNQHDLTQKGCKDYDSTEYAPEFEKYISLVPEGEIVMTLGLQIESTLGLIRGLSAAQGDLRYAPGKWSVKEVIGHLIDAERIFAYRALRFARNDATPLPSFDENSFVTNAGFDSRALGDLAEEFEHTRKSNVYLFKSLDGD